MANYLYQCGCGRQADQQAPIGTAARTMPCPECGDVMRLRIGVGVNVAPSALESKGEGVRADNAREGRWEKDMPAYYRMRHNGLQPQTIDGSARLEDRVGDQFDIKYQPLLDQGISKQNLLEGAEAAQEIMADAS